MECKENQIFMSRAYHDYIQFVGAPNILLTENSKTQNEK